MDILTYGILNKKVEEAKNVSDEKITEAVNAYLDKNPPTTGATAEQAAQIYKNVADIGELKGDIDQLKQGGISTGTGLSTEAIDKLEEVGNYLAYTTADGGSKWTELISILRNGSSGGGSGETVPATGISLDKTTLSFTDSATQTLVATVEPSDTTDNVVWTSNAESVAKVTNGVVKPLSNGSATITATCGSVSATCFVTVDIAEGGQVTLTSISATYTGSDVAVGTKLNDLTGITVTGTYSDGSTSTITGYTLSGEIVEGSNTITVSYGGKTTTFTVTGVAESSGGDTTEAVNLFDKNTMVTELTVFHNVYYGSLTGHGSRDLVTIPIELSEDTWFCISNNSQPASTWKGYDPPQMMVASAPLTNSNNSDAFVRKYYLAWSDLKYDDNINGAQAQDANVITKDTTGVGVAFLVPSNAKYIYINMTHNAPEYWRTLMVEKGKTCHDYVDYVGV